jgi:hypothetical protein
MAVNASALLAISTKPNLLLRPVLVSSMIFAATTDPHLPNLSNSSSFVAERGKLLM